MAANILKIVKKVGTKKSATKKATHEDKPIIELEEMLTIDGLYKTTIPDSYKSRKLWTRPDPKMIHAFIPGTITELFVRKGDVVKKGDNLLQFKAMKMSNTYTSPVSGVIGKMHVRPGYIVPNGALLLEFASIEIKEEPVHEDEWQ